MKTGLILEGGAMRGMFTAGVMDVLMENDITFDGMIGVSAGAVFGCNYKSYQPGRVIRYNTAYCRDPRYASFRSLLRTGDLYGEQFCYYEIPEHLDPFDRATFAASPMEFYVVCTDVQTGKPVYHKCTDGGAEDLRWMRASASMPLVSRIVEIDGRGYLDGGISDSIPAAYFKSIGYDRRVAVLTQPAGYIKKKNRLLPLLRRALRAYPQMIRALEERHIAYNTATAAIARAEAAGDMFVIRPPHGLNIGAVEHHPEKLTAVYQIGRETAARSLDDLRAYLAISGTNK